jgi:hypothetical protein
VRAPLTGSTQNARVVPGIFDTSIVIARLVGT